MSWTFVAEDSLLLLLSSLQLLRVDRVIGFWLKVVRNGFPFSIPAQLYERLTRL